MDGGELKDSTYDYNGELWKFGLVVLHSLGLTFYTVPRGAERRFGGRAH